MCGVVVASSFHLHFGENVLHFCFAGGEGEKKKYFVPITSHEVEKKKRVNTSMSKRWVQDPGHECNKLLTRYR